MIQLLENKDIDRIAWDKCIAKSKNEMPYAYSWFLDTVSPCWSALVWGDYDYVMPLPIKRKWGLRYIAQPFFTQQLGIFSEKEVTLDIVNLFIKAIPCRNILINLNERNYFERGIVCPNHVLNLFDDYETLFEKFSTNTKRNLKKKIELEFTINEQVLVTDFLDLCEKQSFWRPKFRLVAEKIINDAIKNDIGQIVGIITIDGELLAACFLLKSSYRIIYHIAASTDRGKVNFAMYHLVNYLIKKYAGNKLLLDFEGSKVDGIARFYRSFGAEKVDYYRVEKGFLVSLLKLNAFKK